MPQLFETNEPRLYLEQEGGCISATRYGVQYQMRAQVVGRCEMSKPYPRFIFELAMRCLGEASWLEDTKPRAWRLRYRLELFKANALSPFWWWVK